MHKHGIIVDPQSYWNRAQDNEPVFILIGRDALAPATINCWIEMRLASGKNTVDDKQIQDAIRCLDEFSNFRRNRSTV